MSYAKFKLGISPVALSFALLGSCASHRNAQLGSQDWPAGNPFKEADSITLENASKSAGAKKPFRVVFSGNVNGETEPCGCAVNPKGGIDRRLNFLRTEHGKTQIPTLVVDAGNALFPTKVIDKSQMKFLRARADLVLHGHALMGVAAENVGQLDLSAGLDFLRAEAKKNKVHLVSANWVDASGKTLFDPTYETDLGNTQVVVMGLSRGAEAPLEGGLKVLDPAETLLGQLAHISREKAVIVLSDLGVELDRELAAKANRPLIFVGSRDLSSLEIPIHDGKALIVQGQLQGQQWGLIDVSWNPQATGWYNVKLGQSFQERWNSLELDHKALVEKTNSSESAKERADELEKLQNASHDLLQYAPQNLAQKNVYEYRLIDMTVEFAKKNELTPLMAKVKKK